MSAAAEVVWVLAGPGGRLEHRAHVGPSGIHLELGIDGTRTQPLDVPRGHLVPSLIRTLKIRPVKDATGSARPFPTARMADLLGEDQSVRDAILYEADARTGWSISVSGWQLAGINGSNGVHLALRDQLLPVTNTAFYRLLCEQLGGY
ncbi:hypothetical protein J2S40_004753 [Nocardioides luteus]|uniref:Uncharacterized protein n=1 Tax=Nocardioides luteus TaxID=1844 RepID=A0ABQ5T400_9ACTN|nr:hypothetical protein [Nocardioides luteus]MDR7313695.1 hypothetical protein [Nocardioides luteus]GGR63964.1 hypothetical protein GCM10010197_34240 [Nocardioides luteus]GLJ70457.1 hypothetical protein GCM10017579_44930 [Nocardioides luteus]